MHPTAKPYLIRNARVINENTVSQQDVRICGHRIERIGAALPEQGATVIDGTGKYLLPGAIDGQVHFREPGLTHKGDLHSESRAAVAGGVTSFIEMPNTRPNTLTREALHHKYALAAQKSLANYGFFTGVNGGNREEALLADAEGVIGLSDDGLYFEGKGNLLVENEAAFRDLLTNCRSIIAIHAELETLVARNEEALLRQYGTDIPMKLHPVIRSAEACANATRQAIAWAEEAGARLHILHLTTAAETALFSNQLPLAQKKITTEVSIPHLWFCDEDYERLGALIKCNPAVKSAADRAALLAALLDDRIDLVTTDHAPHLLEEKWQPYRQSFSGMPMVQHALVVMLELHRQGKISLEKVVEKMCHNPAILYRIQERGFIREGYFADLVLVDPDASWTVSKENILYKCGWSPLEGQVFHHRVTHSFVNGHLVFQEGRFDETRKGRALAIHSNRSGTREA